LSYCENYYKMANAFKNDETFVINNEEVKFYNQKFISLNSDVNCYEHKIFENGYLLNVLLNYYLNNNSYSKKYIFPNICENKTFFECNNNFTYKILHPLNGKAAKEIVIILHGLNERDWFKYLTWAAELFNKTGKSVVLFPLSFHMDRAPMEWSASRIMNEVSKERKNLIPNLANSSYANAALSTRMNFEPERFYLSGIQSYLDVVQFIEEIKANKHNMISQNAKIDFLGYSAGAFLGELLMMGNYKNYLLDSKLYMFCGGSIVEEMYPSSKSILDGEATDIMKKYYTNNFEENIKRNDYVWEKFNKNEEISLIFKAMLSNNKMQNLRNSLLSGISKKIKVTVLEKDKVFSLRGIKNTFNVLPVNKINILDFDFNYTHEKPFPDKCIYNDKVTYAFNYILNDICAFLS